MGPRKGVAFEASRDLEINKGGGSQLKSFKEKGTEQGSTKKERQTKNEGKKERIREKKGTRQHYRSVYAEWRRPGSSRQTLVYRAMRPLPVLTGVKGEQKKGVAAQAKGSFSGPPG